MKKGFLILLVLCFNLLSWPVIGQEGILREVYDEINFHRAMLGLQQLEVDPGLERMGVEYSKIQAEAGYSNHDLITWGEFLSLYTTSGAAEYDFIGEILQAGPPWRFLDAYEIVLRFINSKKHKEFVEDERYRAIGGGIVEHNKVIYLTIYLGE